MADQDMNVLLEREIMACYNLIEEAHNAYKTALSYMHRDMRTFSPQNWIMIGYYV